MRGLNGVNGGYAPYNRSFTIGSDALESCPTPQSRRLRRSRRMRFRCRKHPASAHSGLGFLRSAIPVQVAVGIELYGGDLVPVNGHVHLPVHDPIRSSYRNGETTMAIASAAVRLSFTSRETLP